MKRYFHMFLLLGVLALAGCACNRSPEVLPVGSVPLTNGYAQAVTPQAKVVTPAPKKTYTRKTTYKKRSTVRKATVKKAPVKKAAVKKPVTRTRRVVRRTPPQPVPPIPMPLEEVGEAGRVPERLQ